MTLLKWVQRCEQVICYKFIVMLLDGTGLELIRLYFSRGQYIGPLLITQQEACRGHQWPILTAGRVAAKNAGDGL